MARSIKAFLAVVAMIWAGSALAIPVMHVHDSTGELGTVDASTGTVSVIGSMGVVMTDIAFSPTGALYGVSFSGLYSIDPLTAAATFIGNLGISDANALVFATDGTLYAAGNIATNLYTVDTTTGAATSLGNMGFGSAGDLAFNSGDLYLASSSNQLVRIDLGNLANSVAVGTFSVSNVFGLASAQNGILYAVAGTNIYQVDTSTAALSNVVNFGGQGLGNAFGESFFLEAVRVPEPGTLVLFGIGLIGIALGARRRKQALVDE